LTVDDFDYRMVYERLLELYGSQGRRVAVPGGSAVVWLEVEMWPIIEACYVDQYVAAHRGDPSFGTPDLWSLPEEEMRDELMGELWEDLDLLRETAGDASDSALTLTWDAPYGGTWTDSVDLLDYGWDYRFVALPGNSEIERPLTCVALLEQEKDSPAFKAMLAEMIDSYARSSPPFATLSAEIHNGVPELVSKRDLLNIYLPVVLSGRLHWEEGAHFERAAGGEDLAVVFGDYFDAAYRE
jgi:hypothetical protein